MPRHKISDALCGALAHEDENLRNSFGEHRRLANPNVRSPEGWHKHQCDECGCTWEHIDDVMALSEEAVQDAHTCPACGEEQRWKHFTDQELVEQMVDALLARHFGLN